MTIRVFRIVVLTLLASLWNSTVLGQDAEEIAKELANPLASLISLPLQLNYDSNIGPDDAGERWTLNVQPVIPITLNDDWLIISRSIVPFISQKEVFSGAGSQSGIGDIVQSFFFSPKEPSSRGWIWGVGPVALVPSGSDDLLTADQWGLGPTAVGLKQQGPWTVGLLANHLWSVSNNSGNSDVNSTYLQPFLSYTTPGAWTYTMNSESTYDWESEQWSVPINMMISKVIKLGDRLTSWQGGLRYWADSTESSPDGWGVRFSVTFLFPK